MLHGTDAVTVVCHIIVVSVWFVTVTLLQTSSDCFMYTINTGTRYSVARVLIQYGVVMCSTLLDAHNIQCTCTKISLLHVHVAQISHN